MPEYIDPRNPVHQTADSIVGEATYPNFIDKALQEGRLSRAQIDFIQSVQVSDMATTENDPVPAVAHILQQYAPEQREQALTAIKFKFGVYAAAETIEAASNVAMGNGNWQTRFDKGGIDGTLLLSCAVINKCLALRR